nr:hypothetical protein [uncultured Draconibacterium sp.]
MTDRFADGDRKIANCRFKLPGGANNLPIDAFKLPIDGLNCRLSHLNCQLTAQTSRWEQKTTRGQLKSFGEHEKWSGDGSTWSVSTSFGPGTAQTTRGRVNSTWGAVDMWVSVLSVSNTSRTERHLKVSQAMTVQPLGVSKTLKVSETEHSSIISTKDEERSVAVEQQSSRFLNRSSLGMTGKLATCNLQLTTELLTIKYNNPSSRRETSTTKNAHLSTLETMGTRDNKLFPFFLISKSEKQWGGLASIFEMSYCGKGNRPPLSPEGGNFLSASWRKVRRGKLSNSGNISETFLNQSVLKGQSGIVANINKTSAYET